MPEKLYKKINDELHKTNYNSLDEFKNLFDFPNTKPLVLINLEGKIEFANQPFENAFGLSKGNFITSVHSDPDIEIILENIIKKKFANFHIDLYFKNDPNGYFVEFQRIIIDHKNFFVIIFTSIIERKKLEEKINNLHYALEFGYIPVATLSYEGKLTYSTRSFEKLVSKNIQEIYKKHISEILSGILTEEEKISLIEAIDKHENWKTVISTISGSNTGFYEFTLKAIDPREGKISGFVLTINDITDHILRIKAVEKSDKRQRMILNNISEPLIIIRKEKNDFLLDNANEAFCSAFNIQSVELVQKDLLLFPNEHFVDTLLTAIDRMNSEKMNNLKFNYKNPEDNSEYICKISSFNYENESSTLYVVSFFDITKQIQTERKLRESYEKEIRLNKLKSAFLANMSHEVRTPLNAIIGYADLLDFEIQQMDDPSLKELTTYLKDGANRLVRLLENIIDVSKIESGEYEISRSEVNVKEMFEKLKNEFLNIASLRKIEIILEIDESSQTINSDPFVIEKIFWELMDNAIKYNIDKGKVIVRTLSLDKYLRFEIIDTGRGISSEMVNEVLKPFMQDDLSGYKRRYEGAGLGLTFAYKATKLLGGDFEIISEKGHGAKVIVTLPKKVETENN